MYSYGLPHLAVQKQDDQHEHTFSNYVRIWDVDMFSRSSYVKNNAFFHQLVSIQNDQIEEKINLNFILLITKATWRVCNKVDNS